MEEVKLLELKANYEKEFNTLEAARQDLTKRRAEIDRKLVELREGQLRLQGKYLGIEELIKGSSNPIAEKIPGGKLDEKPKK